MKRIIFLFLTLLLSSILSTTFAGSSNDGAISKKILVHLKPDITVEYNSEEYSFRDIKGNVVYPVVYNGSTYLPIRAISSLMKEPIEWDEGSKTVFIGKTLSNPSRDTANISTNYAIALNPDSGTMSGEESEMVNAYLKPDILIMYDFTLQEFKDVNDMQVYPIVYNGTTYLPVRAIANLLKAEIVWDGLLKKISIVNEENPEKDAASNEEVTVRQSTLELKSLFEREEILYYEATAKTTTLKMASQPEEKLIIAEAISENYRQAQNLTTEARLLDKSGFSEEELEAYDKILTFAESTEYYILVLENISYMAAQNEDYSMLADTFLYFALDSQTKMEESRSIIQTILN